MSSVTYCISVFVHADLWISIQHQTRYSEDVCHAVLSKCLNKCQLLRNVRSSQETFEPGAAVQAALYKFVL